MLDVAKNAKFAKPIGGDADFTLPLDFSPKGAAQIWDEDKGLRAVGGQLVKLDACIDGVVDELTGDDMARLRGRIASSGPPCARISQTP